MNELCVSLRKRGYWVSVEENELILDKDYIIIEFYSLLEVLHFVGIDFEKGTKGIRILTEEISGDVLKQIERLPKRTELPILPKEKEFEPIGYYNGSYNLNVLELEPETAPLVFALNKVGFYTASSEVTKEQLMIRSFYKDHVDTIQLVLDKAKELVPLAFAWKTEVDERSYTIVVDYKERNMVQEDAYTLAQFFIQCFPSIPESEFEQWN